MTYTIMVYAAYGLASVVLTIWLARTLGRNGTVFLEDVFADQPKLAQAINHLLVVGFYLLNFGYACLLLRTNVAATPIEAIELLASKLGALLVSLGIMHFGNLYLFHRIRRRMQLRLAPPPVAPQAHVAADGRYGVARAQ
jgi:hypothetical protein